MLSPADFTSLVDTHWVTPCPSVTFCTCFKQQGNSWFYPNKDPKLIQHSGLWLGKPRGQPCTLETIKAQISKPVRKEFQKSLRAFLRAFTSLQPCSSWWLYSLSSRYQLKSKDWDGRKLYKNKIFCSIWIGSGCIQAAIIHLVLSTPSAKHGVISFCCLMIFLKCHGGKKKKTTVILG